MGLSHVGRALRTLGTAEGREGEGRRACRRREDCDQWRQGLQDMFWGQTE